MVVYKNGNIFTDITENTIIGHQVNSRGVMGSGIAAQVREMFPVVYKQYHHMCELYGVDNMGDAQIVCINAQKQIYIANLFGQESISNTETMTDYQALQEALEHLYDFTVDWAPWGTVRLPYKIGCGAAHGDWSTVNSIIEEVFAPPKYPYPESSGIDIRCEVWKI
jgi:O-acetyl-ADP-ribose deacetylase (regulator of RNase III)